MKVAYLFTYEKCHCNDYCMEIINVFIQISSNKNIVALFLTLLIGNLTINYLFYSQIFIFIFIFNTYFNTLFYYIGLDKYLCLVLNRF